MSIFKKVVGFLFEEEEEVTEEGELTSVELREELIHEQPPMLKREIPQKEIVEKPASTVLKEAPTLPKQEEKHFVNIEIDEAPKKSTASTTPVRKTLREPNKSEFEFAPVISPIFGADEKSVKKAKASGVPQNRPTIAASPKKSVFDTVISPIYGATNEDDRKPVRKEESSIVVEKEEEQDVSLASYQDMSEEGIVEIDEELHDEDNIPLEDILIKEELSDTEEDLLQFSLFGDDEVVRSEKVEDSYTIKE